jgi:hypothetical protein
LFFSRLVKRYGAGCKPAPAEKRNPILKTQKNLISSLTETTKGFDPDVCCWFYPLLEIILVVVFF